MWVAVPALGRRNQAADHEGNRNCEHQHADDEPRCRGDLHGGGQKRCVAEQGDAAEEDSGGDGVARIGVDDEKDHDHRGKERPRDAEAVVDAVGCRLAPVPVVKELSFGQSLTSRVLARPDLTR